jgi:hypothetical protein
MRPDDIREVPSRRGAWAVAFGGLLALAVFFPPWVYYSFAETGLHGDIILLQAATVGGHLELALFFLALVSVAAAGLLAAFNRIPHVPVGWCEFVAVLGLFVNGSFFLILMFTSSGVPGLGLLCMVLGCCVIFGGAQSAAPRQARAP